MSPGQRQLDGDFRLELFRQKKNPRLDGRGPMTHYAMLQAEGVTKSHSYQLGIDLQTVSSS